MTILGNSQDGRGARLDHESDGRSPDAWPETLTTVVLAAYRAAGGRGEDEVGRLAASTAAYRAVGGPQNDVEAEVRQIILDCARERLDWLLATSAAWQDRNPRPVEPDDPPPRGWPEPNPGDPT